MRERGFWNEPITWRVSDGAAFPNWMVRVLRRPVPPSTVRVPLFGKETIRNLESRIPEGKLKTCNRPSSQLY